MTEVTAPSTTIPENAFCTVLWGAIKKNQTQPALRGIQVKPAGSRILHRNLPEANQ
jgi:hypothetical protein